MCTSNNKPFTGTAVFKGIVKSYPEIKGASNEHQDGKRVTTYKNGLKDGEEIIYFHYKVDAGPDVKSLLFTIFWAIYAKGVTHTYEHSRLNYKEGLKHGVEVVNHVGGDGYRETETNYVKGLREGIHKEYYWLNKYYIDAKNCGKNIGPLKVEAEYHNGIQSGIYRTYTESGVVEDNYITDSNGQIVNGQRKVAFPQISSELRKEELPGGLIRLDFFENGKLKAQKILSSYGGRETFNEIFYENDVITEECFYKRNGKCFIHRKRINGEFVELFNRDKGVNRLAEFGEKEE